MIFSKLIKSKHKMMFLKLIISKQHNKTRKYYILWNVIKLKFFAKKQIICQENNKGYNNE